MKKVPIYQSVTDLTEPTLQGSEINLVDVEYKKIGKNWTLRVFIDKNQGVTVSDCQKLSREIEDLIEIHELINDHYVLEVSSPGLDRPLKKESDFIRNKGKRIQVSTYSPVNKNKTNTGTVRDFSNSTLFLENEKDILEIPLINIIQAKLIIEF
jgi:ribosome maturation factor RimP